MSNDNLAQRPDDGPIAEPTSPPPVAAHSRRNAWLLSELLPVLVGIALAMLVWKIQGGEIGGVVGVTNLTDGLVVGVTALFVLRFLIRRALRRPGFLT